MAFGHTSNLQFKISNFPFSIAARGRAMRYFSTVITVCLLAVFAVIPADAPGSGTEPKQADPAWVWPLPPEQPRVRHFMTVITPEDLGVKKGFFARVWQFIAGKNEADRILSPHGVVSDSKGKVYVADWGAAKVHFFDFEKKKYDVFGSTRSGPLESPIGIALDGQGLVYVSDSVKRRIFVFTGTKNTRVIGDDGLLRPTGIAVNVKEKLLYVVDTQGHRVEVFDLEGKRVRSIGKRGIGAGEFNYPTHIAIDSAGDLYVVDTLNFRVQIFDKAGKFLSKFGSTGTGIHDFLKPKGIAVDTTGNIWVSDSLRNSIQVFNRQGRLLLIFGKMGISRGEFNVPAGLYIDAQDRLYVADSYNYRMQVFQYLADTVQKQK